MDKRKLIGKIVIWVIIAGMVISAASMAIFYAR